MEELYKRVFNVRRAFGVREEFDANESFLWKLHCDLIKAGAAPEWVFNSKKDTNRMNAIAIERLGNLSWDDALRMLHASRQALLEEIEGIPDEPAEIWVTTHALGRLLHAVPPHDLHHADILKRWRAAKST